MENDVHQNGDCYSIRSVYYDDLYDSCMNENEAGVDCRKKYRIRSYGVADSPINLEIKEKTRGLTKKHSCRLTYEECNSLLNGSNELVFENQKVLNQLLIQMRCVNMQPKVIIEYERTAFVHPIGNVRITFDRNIMASKYCDDFFEKNVVGMIPVLPIGLHVLEVKYDEFLPDMIAKQLEIGKLRQTAFSKYYLGRLALNGEFI